MFPSWLSSSCSLQHIQTVTPISSAGMCSSFNFILSSLSTLSLFLSPLTSASSFDLSLHCSGKQIAVSNNSEHFFYPDCREGWMMTGSDARCTKFTERRCVQIERILKLFLCNHSTTAVSCVQMTRGGHTASLSPAQPPQTSAHNMEQLWVPLCLILLFWVCNAF